VLVGGGPPRGGLGVDVGAAAKLPDVVFRALLAANVGVLPGGSLNIERMQMAPLLAADDDFFGHVLHGDVDSATGLLADPTPPFALYRANLDHVGPLGDPFLKLS
jgi:hypothetical protein